MRVWVGCLACCNIGDLVGYWVDACDASDVTMVDVHRHGGYRPPLTSPGAMRWSSNEFFARLDADAEYWNPDHHEELCHMHLDEFGDLIEGK